jgi:hypothetical protein
VSEDRKKKAWGTDEGEEREDVEAHHKAGGARGENDEPAEGDDDVEAHHKAGGARGANDDDNGDDVEAHVKSSRQ